MWGSTKARKRNIDIMRLDVSVFRMHKEPPKPKGRITRKLYSQPVHPIYDTVWKL